MMFQNIMFVMSLSGTISFLCYVLLLPVCKKYCSVKWRFWFLLIVLSFFWLPIPAFLHELKYWFAKQFGMEIPVLAISDTIRSYIIYQDEVIFTSLGTGIVYCWQLLTLVIATTALLYRFICYMKMSMDCKLHETEEDNINPVLHLLQEKVGVKRVKFVFSEACESPYCIGVFRPRIVLPIWMRDVEWNQTYSNVVVHELYHVRHHDLFIRVCALFTIAFNFMNPCAYFLFAWICEAQEYYADACAMQDQNRTDQGNYIRFLVKSSTETVCSEDEQQLQIEAKFTGLNLDFYNIERRIHEMQNKGKKKVWVSCLVTAALLMSGTAAAFTYEAPTIIENNTQDITESIDFWNKQQLVVDGIAQETFSESFAGKEVICLEDYEQGTEEQVICWHEYEDGVVSSHSSKPNGGCKVTYYDASICKKCGRIILEEVLNEVTYKKCPH